MNDPKPGEIWEEADGCLLLRRTGGYWSPFMEEHVPDDAPLIARPLRLRFDEFGQDVTGGAPLQYPPEVIEARRATAAQR